MGTKVTYKEGVILLIVILLTMGSSIIYWKLPAHIGILAAICLLVGWMISKSYTWDDLHEGIISGVTPGIIPILLFMLIGALISMWIACGTIPTIMVYGFSMVSPRFFLGAVFLLCGVIGAAVGSSFTTISTVGVAFVGMGSMLGFGLGPVAGAVVSGAFLGNVLSPLSDTANLAAATAQVDLFAHLKQVLKTSGLASMMSFVFFIVIGSHTGNNVQLEEVTQLKATLLTHYSITPVVLLPVLLLFVCAIKKVPAIPALLLNNLVSIILLKIYHPRLTLPVLGKWLQEGYVSRTGNKMVDHLLSRGGIQSMMWSVSLILLALSLGGLLIKTGILDIILQEIEGILTTPMALITLTALTAIGVNLLIGEQYLSIILPGEAYKHRFKHLDIPLVYLSRTLCDAGSTVNPLVPWGVSAVFITGALGVPTSNYFPYAIFCYLLPLITLVSSFSVNKQFVISERR